MFPKYDYRNLYKYLRKELNREITIFKDNNTVKIT